MESSVLTTKGQIVIPKSLRDKYKLNPGTKVFFEETAEGIILKHIDAAFIKKAKGIIPAKKGEKPMAEWWPAYKAEDRKIEDRKLNLLEEPPAEYKRTLKIKRKK
jgi:AbrB family looped-hinge helix DNA binding protein